MQSDKPYRHTSRRGRYYRRRSRPYSRRRSGRSGRSNSENSEAVSYDSGSRHSSSKSRTPRRVRREPVRRREQRRHRRPGGHPISYYRSLMSRSASYDSGRRGSNNVSRRTRGRRYRSRSSSSSASASLTPRTPVQRGRQSRTSQHHHTRRSESSDSMQRLEDIHRLPREKAPKAQPPIVADLASGKPSQAKPNPPALPVPAAAAASSSSTPQMGLPSLAAQREPLSSPPLVYALDGVLKESMPTRVEATATTPGEPASPHRSTLENEETYEHWLHGGRARTSSWSMGLNTLSWIDTAITPVTGELKTSGSASPTAGGTPAIATDWRCVCLKTPFFVATDLNALQKAPALISTPNRVGEVAPTPGTAFPDHEKEVKDVSQNCSPQPEIESKLINLDEFDSAFKRSFLTGKVHPKPPWYLCALEKDCCEHPYYAQWLDTLELLPSLEEQLARSRERVRRIATHKGKSNLNT